MKKSTRANEEDASTHERENIEEIIYQGRMPFSRTTRQELKSLREMHAPISPMQAQWLLEHPSLV